MLPYLFELTYMYMFVYEVVFVLLPYMYVSHTIHVHVGPQLVCADMPGPQACARQKDTAQGHKVTGIITPLLKLHCLS